MPPDEDRRIDALHRLDILDTVAEERFDRLTELAALVVGTPIALVSLIDRDRQWFKSAYGLSVTETTREVAFCAHAIVADDPHPFEVPDAAHDSRFRDNPLVVGEPGIRFYAGQVIRDHEGYALGTLCVIDRRPRQLDEVQRRALEHIATLVEQELERKDEMRLLVELDASQRNKAVILNTLSEGVVLQDLSGAIVEWNPAAERVLGLSADELSGRTSTDPAWRATHADGSPWSGDEHPAMEVLRSGLPSSGEVMGVSRADGDRRWLHVRSQPVVDADGVVTHALTAFMDVTAEVEHAAARVEMERSLRISERTARVSLDALEQGVLLVDRTGAIQRMNPAAHEILGFTADELTTLWRNGEWVTYDEHGAVLEGSARPLIRVATTRQPVIGQIVGWRRKDGHRILIRLSCTPDADEDGSLVITFTDITSDHLAQRLLDATLETAPVGLAILDTDRSILRCNRTFADQAGRPAAELIGVDVVTLLDDAHQSDATAIGHHIRHGTRSGGELEQRVARPDGTHIWVNTQLAVIPDPDRPLAIAATFDITERRRMMLELSRFEYLFQHANDIIVVVDEHGRVKYASPSNERILGYPDGYRHPAGVFGLVHPDDLALAVGELQALVSGQSDGSPFTARILAADGTWRNMECVSVDLLDQPEVEGVVITARDTTDRERLAQLLAHQARHDPLTGLPNRQLFEERLTRGLARAERVDGRLALCFIDLDGFNLINDRHGHAVGDDVLRRVATALQSEVRSGDTAARIGGDEFVLILDPIVTAAHALEVAGRVRSAVIDQCDPSVGIEFGASVGLAMREPFDSVASLLKRADDALYRAKATHNSAIVADWS
ncbi:MAG: PAS domain S-box protein [Actinomycetota bacterium]|nr:PAS domain S-box protein [Actinomycetota bacterium]